MFRNINIYIGDKIIISTYSKLYLTDAGSSIPVCAKLSYESGVCFCFMDQCLEDVRFQHMQYCGTTTAPTISTTLTMTTTQAYLAWGEFPVITTVSTTALPIDQLPWPSFTICNQVDVVDDDDDDNYSGNHHDDVIDEMPFSSCLGISFL